MKKKSFATAKSHRVKGRGLQKEVKFLKKLRKRKARQNIDAWRVTSAWDVS
jgi:hypothetical protein